MDADSHKGREAGARGAGRVVSLALVVASLALFAVSVVPGLNATASPPPAVLNFKPPAQGAQDFSHATPRHASLACDSCHRRTDNSARPRWPGHKDCTDCHAPEFFTSGSPLCLNCHTDVTSRQPPLKDFPAIQSFNARFDHAAHSQGAARPEQGCASCHLPARRGVALSILAGAGAHDNCYRCHTPGSTASSGRDISSCATCHAPGRMARTPTNSRAYAVSFSHATHGPRQSLRCDSCHTVRAGAGQGRQVASPQPTQHFGSGRARTCTTCHDNRRAFGGDDFADCKRCHKGQTFKF
ncbi:MAG TPA: cytochrome c3 family protein [Pyrinomonadaceae bacterium]|nr:cytochrome c3 family protein [Pyrinomonadaceae bacterium]